MSVRIWLVCWKHPQALAALVYRGEPGLAVRNMVLLWHVEVLTWKVPGSGPSGRSSPGLHVLSRSCFLCLPFGGSVNHSGAEDSFWSLSPHVARSRSARRRLAWLPLQSERQV